jgi:methyltransferase-like protein/SAM-dependent methyltransferase
MLRSNGYAYDCVLYPSYLHAQTHPDRLATIGTLFGMTPKPVEDCRVLELGCGTAGSLLSFALDLNESEFVGVDLGKRQIEFAEQVRKEVGLDNLRLMHGDVMNLTRDEMGEFDYIIAHGLFSWTPEPVRGRILEICSEMLSPQGIAFISYNAYPGAHFRQIIREMMLFHTREFDDPEQKVEQAMAIVKFIAEGIPSAKPFKAVIESELKSILERSPETVFHDELSEINQPFYLHQFVELAEQHGLKYLADVQYFSERDVNYSNEVHEALENIGNDRVRREQYIDFLNCRPFRQSVICRSEVNTTAAPRREALDQMLIASHIRPQSEEPDLNSDKVEPFTGPKGEMIQINHPLTKAALVQLSQTWPRMLRFTDVAQAAAERLKRTSGDVATISDDDVRDLHEVLFRMFGGGMLEFHLHQPSYCDHLSEKPNASPLARWQAAHATDISNLRHEGIRIKDPFALKLIQLLDGTRDEEQIFADMLAYVRSPVFRATDDQRAQVAERLSVLLKQNLLAIAKDGLLVV